MRLSIVIVNYNTRDLTTKCLQSIYRIKNQLDLEVIIVDNASSDNSASYLKEAFPDIKYIVNQKNVGFGPANNQAAKIAVGNYLLFLNSDTEVIGDNLKKFLECAEINQSPLASCRLVNRDGSLQPQGGELPNLINLKFWMLFIDDLPIFKHHFFAYQRRDPAYFQKNQHPGWVAGTALMIKKDIFTSLGGFNPEIFMYGEDVDLCFRAKRQGYRIDYFAAPQILHLGQGSGTSQQAIEGELKFIEYFYHQYLPTWKYPLLRLLLKIGCLLRILLFGMIGRYESKKVYQQAFRMV